MIITRKLELKVVGDNKEESWQLLRYYFNTIHKLNNYIVTQYLLNDLIKDKFTVHSDVYKEKIEKVENNLNKRKESLKSVKSKIKLAEGEKKDKLSIKQEKLEKEIDDFIKQKYAMQKEGRKEAEKQFKELYGIKLDSSINQMIRSVEEFKDIPDTIISPAIAELSFYKKNIFNIKNGNEKVRIYQKGMPFNTRGRDLKFYSNENDVFIKWVKKIEFKINFGRDKSNNREIINRVINGTYKVSDSKIQYSKKGKLFLLLCVDIPSNNNILDPEKVMGVDLGIKYPAYISVNNGHYRKALGSAEDFLRIRLQLRSRRKRLQRQLRETNGGKGRTKKLKALERWESKERNWVKTYNHKISKMIVDESVKQECGQINLEFLKGFKDTNNFILSHWSYYELQTMIEYKAKRNNIIVKYVDPYHTSQICSKCGHYEEGQRVSQEIFKCKKCDFAVNADFNASKNIALSKNYVTMIEQCEYYKSVDAQ